VYDRLPTQGEIQAVRESLTTAGGTFSTVRYKSTQGATQAGVTYSLGWYDIASGALVRQQQFNSSNVMVRQLDAVSMH
jgi:uncharacterized protein YcfL